MVWEIELDDAILIYGYNCQERERERERERECYLHMVQSVQCINPPCLKMITLDGFLENNLGFMIKYF